MEQTNEFLRGMFAAYMGCKVQSNLSGRLYSTVGISFDGNCLIQCRINDLVHLYPKDLQPILTPLSDITDEDAVAVIMLGVKLNKFEVLKIKRFNSYLVVEYRWESDIPELNWEDGFSYSASSFSFSIMELKVWQIDYLRFKKYDCGYMHIPSLITAGLAIKKTT